MPSLKAMAREAQKKPKAGALKEPPNRKQTMFKSTERVADSDLESETESESGSDSEEGSTVVPVHVAKPNGQTPKPVAGSNEAESEEEDDEEDESESQADAVISSNHGGTSSQTSDKSESGSDGGSDSDSESAEEHEHGKGRVAAEKTSSHIGEEVQAKSDKTRAIPTFNPPDGFAIQSEINDGEKKVAEVFGRSNLTGKQLWYITAPASVPISAVKQVSLQDVQLGKPALSLDGRNYGFVQDQAGDRDFTKVLIPDGNSTAYRVGQKAVDQTLHLQQIIQLHKITNMSSPASGVSATVSKRPVRKQPEGLKMRFRPIGFGNGKTGTIGSSSSSSDASSSTDNDADEEIEDAPQVSRQPLAKANASQDDTSSSGEEMDDPPPAALADSPSDSDSSSEPSNNKREDLPKITSAPEISSNSPPRPLKRKLSDLKKDDKTSNTLCDQFKANGVPLKTTNIKKLSPALGQSVSKVNGNANTTTKQNILSTSPPKMTQVVLPPRVSETTSSPANGSNLKVTPVPPPRQSSILPPGRGTKSLDVPKVLKAAGARSKTSPVKVAAAKLPPEKNNQKSLEDHIQSIDPTLSEKEREKDIRRLRKKEASRISKNQRRESMNSATSDTLDRSINASSPSRNAQQHRFQAISAPKSSADKELSRDVKRNITTSMEKVSKKPKKHPSSSIIHNENGGTAKPSYGTSTTIPLPRKESVILPPKLNRSMSR